MDWDPYIQMDGWMDRWMDWDGINGRQSLSMTTFLDQDVWLLKEFLWNTALWGFDSKLMIQHYMLHYIYANKMQIYKNGI